MRFLKYLPLVLLLSCASKEVTLLIDKDKVEKVVNRIYVATDEKDWESIKTLFADKVQFDMSSISGQAATVETPTSIAKMWSEGLKDVPFVHHQSGNFFVEVNGNEATVHNYAMPTHYFPDGKIFKTRWFVGSYDWHLLKSDSGWKVDEFRFKKQYVSEVK